MTVEQHSSILRYFENGKEVVKTSAPTMTITVYPDNKYYDEIRDFSLGILEKMKREKELNGTQH